MASALGVPVKLLHEALGHIITVELKTGQLYRGKLAEAEDSLNISLRDITVTGRDGRVSQLDQVYIRGSMIRFFIVPDMLQNAPMFKRVGPNAMRGRGIGTARGRATIMRGSYLTVAAPATSILTDCLLFCMHQLMLDVVVEDQEVAPQEASDDNSAKYFKRYRVAIGSMSLMYTCIRVTRPSISFMYSDVLLFDQHESAVLLSGELRAATYSQQLLRNKSFYIIHSLAVFGMSMVDLRFSPPGPPGSPGFEHHELPLLAPLSHSHPLLSSSTAWDVDAFLLSRPNLSLQDLRSELRNYSAQLKEELVQLINDDYAAFISLSTDLKGEGTRLERLHQPIANVKSEIDTSRVGLLAVQDTVTEKLAERAALREEKALLNLLLKLSDLVLRLETLLLISSSEQPGMGASQTSIDFSALGVRGMNGMPVPSDEDIKDERFRGSQAKHLARVAAEYTQLLYHAEKARREDCVFVDELQHRIDRIKTTLTRDLDNLFSNTLVSLTSASVEAASVADKTRWTAELTECMRTYDLLRNWRDAEEVVRRDLVRPFVKNTIFSGALDVAPSPILVRTLLPGKIGHLSPRTPFTPFTSGRANPFDTLVANPPPVFSEEEEGNPLASLFSTVIRFVQVNCGGVLELSYRISAKNRKAGKLSGGLLSSNHHTSAGDENEVGVNPDGFEIMANVIWAEIGRTVMEELGSVVFSAGNPEEFQKLSDRQAQNYTTTNNFITALEHLAPSLHAVEAIRAHPTYAAFQRRWQLPVYFQLRWKEIVGKLEESLSNSYTIRGESLQDGFVSPQAYSFFTAIESCWSSHIFIPEISHQFWRLTLQLLSRYKSWTESGLPVPEPPSNVAAAIAADKGAASGSALASRSTTPLLPSTEGVDTSAADEISLQRLADTMIDLANMERRVWDLWGTEIGMLLPEHTTEEEGPTPEDVLRLSINAFATLRARLSSQVILILIRRCSDTLSLVRSIPSQYRAMSKKKDPTGPSYFVPTILQPIRRFFEQKGVADLIPESDRRAWTAEAFDTVATRYIAYIDAMKKTEDSLRRYKKGKISAFSLFGNAGSKDVEEGKDEERVRAQIVLDVDALGDDAKRLGVDVDSSEAFTALKATAAHTGE
ncbi:hypothetical protein FRB97_002328 [Tulasnella sp. 331]|nr:hypothetical protein FRB97_002328 [Tulasnella sp. 331]